MLQRSTRRLLPALNRSPAVLRAYSTTTDNPVPTNNPNPTVSKTRFTVSETNRLPSSSTGSHDNALYEDPDEGEKKRVMQAPNREGVWSRSQQPRAKAMVGPRFEQTIMEDQVCCRSAMGAVATWFGKSMADYCDLSHDHLPRSTSSTNSQYDGRTSA